VSVLYIFVYFTYFYCLGYLCAKNYQIWWRSDEVLTKTSWVIFWHTLYIYFSMFGLVFVRVSNAAFCCMQFIVILVKMLFGLV